jgi:hypothetical protein
MPVPLNRCAILFMKQFVHGFQYNFFIAHCAIIVTLFDFLIYGIPISISPFTRAGIRSIIGRTAKSLFPKNFQTFPNKIHFLAAHSIFKPVVFSMTVIKVGKLWLNPAQPIG